MTFKLFKLGMLIAFIVTAFAITAPADINKEFTFAWQQDAGDLAELLQWNLYWADTQGGPYTPVLDTQGNPVIIPYDPNDPDGDYTTTQIILVPGPPGSTVRKFFVMTAVAKSNDESAFSAEAINDATGDPWVDIKIPMGRPFSLTVTVKPGNVP